MNNSLNPKQVRRQLGLTQQAMADAMGLTSKHTWVKWERGERVPNAAARQLMSALIRLNDIGQLQDFLANKMVII